MSEQDAKWLEGMGTRYIPEPNTGCWLWALSTSWGGYGSVKWGGRTRQAHRVAYEELRGPIPEGLTIDHLCRVRSCVNPAHMEPVTRGVNVLRGIGISSHCAHKTHCKHGHQLGGENVRPLKGKPAHWRTCLACRMAYVQKEKDRRRAKRSANKIGAR